jgi:hypothetical protein
VLGNSTGENIYNLKQIYKYKRGTFIPGTINISTARKQTRLQHKNIDDLNFGLEIS